MFNSPRSAGNQPQRYTSTTSNGFGASFVDDNHLVDPLAASVYDGAGLDPWSAAPTPPSLPPVLSSSGTVGIPSGSTLAFGSVLADAMVPPIYDKAFSVVDASGTGETSVNSLSRVLATSGLSAFTVDRIVNLVSTRPRVSRIEFFTAMALAALAQSGSEPSIEEVASLASQNALPEPTLDLAAVEKGSAMSPFSPNPYAAKKDLDFGAGVGAPSRSSSGYPDDPWNTARFTSTPSGSGAAGAGAAAATTSTATGAGGSTNGVPSSLAGTGLPSDWWKKQETATVSILGQQGFILNRYTVYNVTTSRGAPIQRRYSEFVFLWDVLVRRYPFRLLPALPPKRVGPDEGFIEQRRRGLARFLTFVINHPVIKDDGLLRVFLTEPSFEVWRKNASISLDEESVSKRIDMVEEMTIPSDLDDKLAVVRGKISPMIEQWQRICILAERIIKRREGAAVRIPSALKRTYLPAHFTLPFSNSSSSASLSSPSSSSSSNPRLHPTNDVMSSGASVLSATTMAGSVFGGESVIFGGQHGHGHGHGHGHVPVVLDQQADLARLTNTMKVLMEINERCWRGDNCDLCSGVRTGLGHTAEHLQRHSDMLEQRTHTLLYATLESLKMQRDLYMAMRDLFIRHDRLAVDQVDRLRKRVDANSMKLEGVKAAGKDGWQDEVERLVNVIGKDQAAITTQLNRRVFIRACLWHELRVVLHNRENVLLTQTIQSFAREEHDFVESVVSNWASLGDVVDAMPYE